MEIVVDCVDFVIAVPLSQQTVTGCFYTGTRSRPSDVWTWVIPVVWSMVVV